MTRLEDDLEWAGHAGNAGHVAFWWGAAFYLGQDLVLVQQACAMSAYVKGTIHLDIDAMSAVLK